MEKNKAKINLYFVIPMCVFGAIICTVLTALILDKFIFNNNYTSRVSNGEWAAFIGSFLGALIGGGATIFAVYLQMRNNKENLNQQRADNNQNLLDLRSQNIEDKRNEEAMRFRPFISFTFANQSRSFGFGTANINRINKTGVELKIKNYGNGAALNVEILSKPGESRLLSYKITLGAQEENNIKFELNEENSKEISILYSDVLGNKYSQVAVPVISSSNNNIIGISHFEFSLPEIEA